MRSMRLSDINGKYAEPFKWYFLKALIQFDTWTPLPRDSKALL